jgi:hypothetical protein
MTTPSYAIGINNDTNLLYPSIQGTTIWVIFTQHTASGFEMAMNSISNTWRNA